MSLTPLVTITVALLVAFVGSEVAKHFHYPRTIGQILAGALLGLPLFKEIVTEQAITHISFLAQIGVIFFFVIIGLEFDTRRLKEQRQRSFLIASSTIGIPFLCGILLAQALGYSWVTALVLGVCLSLSSATTVSQVFVEMKLLKKPLAKLLVGASILTDLFGILFLAFLLPSLEGDVESLVNVPLGMAGFVVLIWGLTKLMPLFITHIEKDESRVAEVSMVTLFGLIVAALSSQFGLGEMLGAFLAGLILQSATRHECSELCGDQKKLHKRYRKFFEKNITSLKVITLSFIIPFLFISMGLSLDLTQVFLKPGVVGTVIAVGIGAKLLAALVTRPLAHLNGAQTKVVAWTLNVRGTLELVIAELTLRFGLISSELYTALVLMVVLTTLMMPFFLRRVIQRHPRALELRAF